MLDTSGVLATCCCSGIIDMPMLAQFAEQKKRTIQILERTGQAADYPVLASCPAGAAAYCLLPSRPPGS